MTLVSNSKVVGLGKAWVKPLFLVLILTTLIPLSPVNAISAYSRVATTTVQLSGGDVIAPHVYTWYFDGNTGQMTVPYSSSIDFSNTEKLTYCGVVNLITPTQGDNYPGLFIGTDDWTINWRATDNSPYFQWVGVNGNGYAFLANGLYLTRGDYHHICFSMDFTGSQPSLEVVDGTTRASSTITQMFNESNRNAYFPSKTFNGYIALVALYSRALYSSEAVNAYSKYEFNSLGLVIFIDATFWNGANYVDLSGNNNNPQPSLNGVSRVLDNKTWLYHIVQLYNDNNVHFRFFPYGSKIEIYDASGKLVTSFYLNGNADAGDMIEDYAISLSPGTYTIKAYMLPTSFAPGYPANYCGIIQNTDSNAIVSCACDGLTDQYGIYIDNPDTSQTYTFVVSTTYTKIGDRILFSMYPDSPPKVELNLPLQSYTLSNGSQISVTGIKVRITYIENTTTYQSVVILTQDNYTGSLTLTFNQYDVITEVALFLYVPTPPQALPPTPGSIWDIKGWVSMLAYMTWQFVQYIPTVLTILVNVGGLFTQLIPLFVAVIPLSIIGALVEGGVDDAVKVASFWYELARKLYDFFIKVIQAIAELIDALKPV